MQTCNYLLDFKHRQPRRNLPSSVSRKRGESNFVAAFTKAYIKSVVPKGVGGTEFPLSGYGIADFVWLAWQESPTSEDGTALSLETLKSKLSRKKLMAFEMKMTDWRKGLSQAYRYSYFADITILVLPLETAALAKSSLDRFREHRVGLWSFDKATGKICRLFTPRASKPRNANAREKALNVLSQRLVSKFCKPHKQVEPIS